MINGCVFFVLETHKTFISYRIQRKAIIRYFLAYTRRYETIKECDQNAATISATYLSLAVNQDNSLSHSDSFLCQEQELSISKMHTGILSWEDVFSPKRGSFREGRNNATIYATCISYRPNLQIIKFLSAILQKNFSYTLHLVLGLCEYGNFSFQNK